MGEELERKAKIKFVRLLKRRADLTQEQFQHYWLTEHSKLEKKVMESGWVRRIVASFAAGEVSGAESPFDGMVELFFDTKEDLQALVASHIPEMMREDEHNFIDLSGEIVRVVMEEFTMGEK